MEGDGRDTMRRMIFMCALFTAMYSVAAGLGRGESVAEAKAAAEKGDSAAQFRYAEMLRTGNGVATNLAEAVVWSRKAADGGCA